MAVTTTVELNYMRAMEEYATEVAKEALIEGAKQASEYIYELKIDNSIMHHLIRRITDSKNIPTQ